ncbi:Acyl-CoA thioesterase [Solimonas aquatica]|uniref:Acyl-CoA thioesterase n=1 Tax=Solimonas aquatica TaxID=489703 RepID=A0A1H9KJ48_9GAMM|nr:thioesterase family protein [Solimonas aquatica]SEQ98935.1 Acyl-CoA thioesterase [Solimonas aquatica]
MKFSQVLALDDAAPVPESWAQGRTLFGGLQGALLLRAMRRLVPGEIPLRSLQVSFIAPVSPGVPRIEARLLRSGKSVVQVEARILDGDNVACLAVGIFGRARESSIRLQPAAPQNVAPPEQTPERAYKAGRMPEFLQHLQFRWVLNLPCSGASEARTQTWVRLLDEAPVGEAQLIALADAIPTPAISLLRQSPMASSMTWTLELLRQDYDADPAGYWLIDAEANAAADGYVNQTATLWSPDGKAVALSRQTVVVFA